MNAEPCPNNLTFTRIEYDHIEPIMEIEVEAYPEPWTRSMFRQEVESPLSRFYVVFLGDIVVGYVGYWKAVDEAHITSVTVRKDFRGRGFGRTILEFILRDAAQLGLQEATLEVRVSNTVAQSLYTSMGFKHIGRRIRYYTKTNEDAFVMVRPISSDDLRAER